MESMTFTCFRLKHVICPTLMLQASTKGTNKHAWISKVEAVVYPKFEAG
jgi:hypothetical protein